MASAVAPVRHSAADRRQQILQAAMGLFARRGFNGTTTREIARRARVNEAIIFRHFPSKEDLYWAVIEYKCQRSRPRQVLEKNLSKYSDDREAFASLAEEILERRAQDGTLSRLLLFTALENHRLSDRFFRSYVAQYFEILADYIRSGISLGRFRDVEPLLAARGFLGMVVYHSWMQELFGWKRYLKFDNKQVSRTLTDIWLQGMLPPNNGETRARTRKPNSASNGQRER